MAPPASPAGAAALRTPERTPPRGSAASSDGSQRLVAGSGAPSLAALGVLQSHVSRLQGFRPRLFRLRGDELTCFKMSGDAAKRSVLPLLQRCDVASLRAFGPEWAASLLADAQRAQEAAAAESPPPPPVVKRIARLQGASVRLSTSDDRRFTLLFASSAVLPLELRTESAACRAAWVEALTSAAAASAQLEWQRPPATPSAAAPATAGEAADAKLAAAHAAARDVLAAALAGECSAGAALSALDDFAAAAAARCAAGSRRRAALRGRLRAVRAERDALEAEVLRCTGAGAAAVSGAASFSFAGATPEPPRGAHAAAAHALRTPPPPPLARWRSMGTPPLAPRTLRRALSDAAAPPRDDDDADGRLEDGDDDDATSASSFAASERHSRPAGYSSSSDDDDAAAAAASDDSDRGETWFDAAPGDGANGSATSLDAAAIAAAAPPTWSPRRDALPVAAQSAPSASLWALLRSAIGKDLTRLCLPVAFNEPLSALQGIAEEFEHSWLLDAAAAAPRGSAARHALVAAFAVAGYARTANRGRKPFNPLEGETYELRAPERRLRFLAEKARHHPPVLTWHAQGGLPDDHDVSGGDGTIAASDPAVAPAWEAWGTAGLQPRFGGRRLELRPSGGCAVAIPDATSSASPPEVFTWNRVTSHVSNLVLGPLAVSHAGAMRVRSDVSGAVWTLHFRDALPGPEAASRRGAPAVRGSLDGCGASIEGAWWGAPGLSVQLRPGGGTVPLWAGGGTTAPGRAGADYRWSAFAAGLNELTPQHAQPGALPPTDSRLRPDQRLLEQGRYAEADAAKQRLEEKQRAARRRAAQAGGPPPPRWFRAAQPPPGAPEAAAEAWYEYAGGYWEASRAREWPGVRRIFDDDVI